MAARLTDRQKKMIIADRAEGMSLRQLADKYSTSATTIHRVVNGDPETERIVMQKKEENTADMLAYMDSVKGDAQRIIGAYMEELVDPDKISGATLSQIATAFGIVVDKFTKNTASGNDSLHKLDRLLEEFKDAVKSEAT